MPIPGATSAVSPPPARGAASFIAGGLALLVASAATATLSLDHLGLISPPGCGAGSPCRAATSSQWGTVPGLNWPVSFVGFTYFLSVLVLWVRERGELSLGVRWLTRAGALGSIFFIGVMLVENLPCKYCLTSHIANLLFLGLAEWKGRRSASRPAGKGLAVGAAVFAAASVGLGFAEAQVQAKLEKEREASTQAIIEASKPKTSTPASGNTPPNPASSSASATSAAQQAAQPTTPIVLPTIFTGRYRWGPEIAPIRIVLWTGYQCPDCKKMEPQVREVMKRKDVSVSIKHFPFCPDCNPHVPANHQPNGCWAARAAEAAGILKGSDGFWKMHEWLFSRAGGFTDKDLMAVLLQFGWDSATFIQTMQGPTTLRNVQTDCEEALVYGMRFTPMIFINGVELKGWSAANALINAVEQVAAAKPDPRGPEVDRPIKAGDKYVADWRDQPQMAWPSRPNLPAIGNPNAKIKVTIFGDLLEPNTAEADKTIRDSMAGRDDMFYEFRYFPVDRECNNVIPQTQFPGACRAAKAAEAANTMGGAAAYWKMHEWIQANAKNFNDTTLRAAAKEMGLDDAELFRRMDSADINKLMATEISIGSRLHIAEIPRISVNGKHVPRWKLKDQFVLERIIDEAGQPEAPK